MSATHICTCGGHDRPYEPLSTSDFSTEPLGQYESGFPPPPGTSIDGYYHGPPGYPPSYDGAPPAGIAHGSAGSRVVHPPPGQDIASLSYLGEESEHSIIYPGDPDYPADPENYTRRRPQYREFSGDQPSASQRLGDHTSLPEGDRARPVWEPGPWIKPVGGEGQYTVTWPTKQGHPQQHRIVGTSQCIAIDGIKGGGIRVARGKTYTFHIQPAVLGSSPPPLAFYFTADSIGGPGGVWTDNTQFQPVSLPNSPLPASEGSVTLTIDDQTPGIFYYQCPSYPCMGGVVYVIN
jgi:hypothetical protein